MESPLSTLLLFSNSSCHNSLQSTELSDNATSLMLTDSQSEGYNVSDTFTNRSSQSCSDDKCTSIREQASSTGLLDQYNAAHSQHEENYIYKCNQIMYNSPKTYQEIPKIKTFSEFRLTLKLHALLEKVANGRLTPSALYCLVTGKKLVLERNQQVHQKGFGGRMLLLVQLCCVLEIAHELLISGQVAYQRDVYYRHKVLLKSVENVRYLCGQLALFLTVRPSQLGIISCPKGLMAGQISFELNDGSVIDFSTSSGQTLPHADFVTAYFALLESGFRLRFPWAILATGKGYPDINTRRLISMLPSMLEIVVLVDYDPDGAHIYQVYAEGGLAGMHQYQLNARWAGLDCSMARIGRWGLDANRMIEFTFHDWRLGLRLINHWAQRPTLRRRIARMVYRGKKAELEIVTRFREMLLDYVDSVL
ncbi:DNA topoisomerase IV, alpha subunit [Coemansia reversa NRRL 1564]|uniref:DNA topoisomerase (ATP-hydrolyzing) n=1 Tax=Coemansia reversa (strain ATCC 12441 / NRRL 1564) TaxID=763665 RepID=A0A2G5B9G5_COERN|nr:DNA topoisomerase IV, alpha subunit [Coemansia reversa NRRL 1564]|eukprot:PIA15651.1 DNA topoisomerase IV, alpha subunit [Coemansia reversa NRRL 1564]